MDDERDYVPPLPKEPLPATEQELDPVPNDMNKAEEPSSPAVPTMILTLTPDPKDPFFPRVGIRAAGPPMPMPALLMFADLLKRTANQIMDQQDFMAAQQQLQQQQFARDVAGGLMRERSGRN